MLTNDKDTVKLVLGDLRGGTSLGWVEVTQVPQRPTDGQVY